MQSTTNHSTERSAAVEMPHPSIGLTLEEALMIKKLKEEKESVMVWKWQAARKAGFIGVGQRAPEVRPVPFLLQAPLDTPEKLQALADLAQPPLIHRTTTVETMQPKEIDFCMVDPVVLDRLKDRHREDGLGLAIGPRIMLDGKVRRLWKCRPVSKDG